MNPYVANSFSNWGVTHRLPMESSPCLTSHSGTSSFGMSGVYAHAIIAAPELAPFQTFEAAAQPWKRSMRCFVETLTAIHPLLHTVAPGAGRKIVEFRLRLDRPCLGFLWDHQVNGAAIMPGAAYLETAAAVAQTLAKVPNPAIAQGGNSHVPPSRAHTCAPTHPASPSAPSPARSSSRRGAAAAA